MTSPSNVPMRLRDLAPHRRRHVWLAAIGRSLLFSLALLVVYFSWPASNTTSSLWELAVLVVGLAIFTCVFAWQVRSIMTSNLPEARAVEALAVVSTLFVVLMSVIYMWLDGSTPDAFSQPLNRMGALYFTITVLTTVGFGDITASTDGARAAVTVQMVANVVFLSVIVKVLLGVSKVSLNRANPALGNDESHGAAAPSE